MWLLMRSLRKTFLAMLTLIWFLFGMSSYMIHWTRLRLWLRPTDSDSSLLDSGITPCGLEPDGLGLDPCKLRLVIGLTSPDSLPHWVQEWVSKWLVRTLACCWIERTDGWQTWRMCTRIKVSFNRSRYVHRANRKHHTSAVQIMNSHFMCLC